MNETVIQTTGLGKTFGKVTAVKSLDLSIKRGEIFGLLGPDGAGKSTIIRLLCGILSPTSGAIRIDGFDPISHKDLINPRIGYVSEGFPLYENLTVRENLDFYARLRGISSKESAKRRKELLRFSRLELFEERRAENLSGGMKKKLALCCALIHAPEILFLDEPTTGVDPLSRRDLWTMLLQFQGQGITICISTPYMDEAERCHRLALIYDGLIVGYGTPEELKSRVPGECLELSVSSPWKAVEALSQQEGVIQSQVLGSSVRLAVDKVDHRIKHIQGSLSEKGIQLQRWSRVPFNMEDVFVALVGQTRKVREANPIVAFQFQYRIIPDKNSSGDNSVITSNLTKKFDSFTAVDNISFKVRRGEIFGFLGPNGAGKSTTIRMLCGIMTPTSGTAHVLGYDVATEAESLKSRIGYMSQRFSLYKDLTVEENIYFYARLYGIAASEMKNRKNQVLEMAGLKDRRNTLAGQLAGGWKQRLALGCAIIHSPDMVFLDEPTAGVDPVSRREFWSLINHMSSLGITVFITTHYMDEAEHCQTLGLIYQGRLAALGSPDELKKGINQPSATIEDVFVSVAAAHKEV